jgi:hypothetical protein
MAGWSTTFSQRLALSQIMCVGVMCALVACASIEQFPTDPEDTQVTLSKYQSYFNPDLIDQYERSDPAGQKILRNTIVINRMLAYDLTYSDFKRSLAGNANAISAGGDLVLLALAGLIATTGNAGTKAALGAASVGILGAQAAITKDLYFQRTLPALLSQMDANRARAKAAIMAGLQLDVDKYPLHLALLDLNALKDAGSVVAGIGEITQQAVAANASAQEHLAAVTFTRGADFRLTLQDRRTLLAAINGLYASDKKKLVQVAVAMEPFLEMRSAKLRAAVSAIDPNRLRLTDADRARLALSVWAAEEDPNPANFQQWQNALK